MKFGACTWIFGDEPLLAKAQRIAAIGLDGVELFGDLSLDPREARNILADHHLAVLSLTPDNVDLCHPDRKINRPALDYYLRLIDFAAEVGAPLLSCHGQVGRVRAVSSYTEETATFSSSMPPIRIGKPSGAGIPIFAPSPMRCARSAITVMWSLSASRQGLIRLPHSKDQTRAPRSNGSCASRWRG